MKINISEKVSAMLDKMGGKSQYYVFAGFLLLIFLLDYFVLMRPQLGSLGKLNPEIKILSDQIKKAEDDMHKLGTYKDDLKNLSKRFEEANLKVRSRDDVPSILEHITYIAGQTGVKIDQIMPDSLDQELLTENNQIKYFDLPIYMEVRSGYHNFGRFVNRIGTDDIPLRVGSFSITSTNNQSHHLIKLTLKATVYEEVGP